ncbi:Os08g0194501, partial [Oryza sativa Japonica Group]
SSSPGLEATPTRQRFDLAVVGSTSISICEFGLAIVDSPVRLV